MKRFVIVENLSGVKIGYIEINLKQVFGNIRDSSHNLAMRYMELKYPDAFSSNLGSKFLLSSVLKREPKKLYKY